MGSLSNINVFRPETPGSHTLKVVTRRIRFHKDNLENEDTVDPCIQWKEEVFNSLEEVQNYIISMTQKNETLKKMAKAMPDKDGNCYYLASFLET